MMHSVMAKRVRSSSDDRDQQQVFSVVSHPLFSLTDPPTVTFRHSVSPRLVMDLAMVLS